MYKILRWLFLINVSERNIFRLDPTLKKTRLRHRLHTSHVQSAPFGCRQILFRFDVFKKINSLVFRFFKRRRTDCPTGSYPYAEIECVDANL